ncbi:hypothetical protein [Streptomyces parvulus]|uniref:Uncharacterized protein n=1 Tax=Streptomyces parvulus TaxID=146923 RepID=A0A369UWF5_9ACTN|nr:hypothetical protein [Streptomyces parvulus]RDD85076.1 hypothetical protein DVZ84_31535 [Streptomyces parvulus]
MPDALYQRYLDAATAYREHRASCTSCTDDRRCPEGQQRWTLFEQRQDAHLKRVRNARKSR